MLRRCIWGADRLFWLFLRFTVQPGTGTAGSGKDQCLPMSGQRIRKQKCFHLVKFLVFRRAGQGGLLSWSVFRFHRPFPFSFLSVAHFLLIYSAHSAFLFQFISFGFSIYLFIFSGEYRHGMKGCPVSGMEDTGWSVSTGRRRSSGAPGAAVPPSIWRPTGGAGRSDLPLPDLPGSAGFHPEAAVSGGRYVMDRPGAA